MSRGIAVPRDQPAERPRAYRAFLLRYYRKADERSLTQILQGLDAIDTDQHELDAPTPLDMVELAAAHGRDGSGGS